MAYTAAVSTFTYNSVVIDAVGSCALSYSRAPLEVTQIGSANTHFISGIANAAISLEIYYNLTNHAAFTTAMLSGGINTFVVTLGTSDTISGSCYVVGYDFVTGASDIVRASISLQVDGAVTINSVAAAAGSNES